jgi:hypothetical protein
MVHLAGVGDTVQDGAGDDDEDALDEVALVANGKAASVSFMKRCIRPSGSIDPPFPPVQGRVVLR